MESVALSTFQLDLLARLHPTLRRVFKKTCAWDQLPSQLEHGDIQAYIVNADGKDKPGSHWFGLFFERQKNQMTCFVMDSYGIPLEHYKEEKCGLLQWLRNQNCVIVPNTRQLQAINSNSCGHYALFFLINMCHGRSLQHFLEEFSVTDFVKNDHKIGKMLETLVKNDIKLLQSKSRETNQQSVLQSTKIHSTLLKDIKVK